MKTEKQETIRAKGVAQRYGIGLSTVWYLAKEGKITPIKVTPRVTVFSIKELDALFSVNEVA